MHQPANDPRPPETRDVRLKRLRHQSWRRGTREMDLILGQFADTQLGELKADDLDGYEALMEENDWDLYYWVTGARETPALHAHLVDRIGAFHGMR